MSASFSFFTLQLPLLGERFIPYTSIIIASHSGDHSIKTRDSNQHKQRVNSTKIETIASLTMECRWGQVFAYHMCRHTQLMIHPTALAVSPVPRSFLPRWLPWHWKSEGDAFHGKIRTVSAWSDLCKFHGADSFNMQKIRVAQYVLSNSSLIALESWPNTPFRLPSKFKPGSIQQSLARRWCPNRLSGDAGMKLNVQKFHSQLITRFCQASFSAHRPHH